MLVFLCVSACAQKSLKITVKDNYPLTEAHEVFFAGFKSISERYIEIASPAKFTINGLQGLGSIDPALTFEASGGEVILRVNNKIADRFFSPFTDDIMGWSELTVKMVKLSRQKSEGLRAATPEKIYEAVFDSILSSLDI